MMPSYIHPTCTCMYVHDQEQHSTPSLKTGGLLRSHLAWFFLSFFPCISTGTVTRFMTKCYEGVGTRGHSSPGGNAKLFDKKTKFL